MSLLVRTVGLRAATILLGVWVAACDTGGATQGGLDDSTYVRTLAGLRRLHDARQFHPVRSLPQPLGIGGRPPSADQLRVRDSLQKLLADSALRADSVARTELLARAKVTPEQLLATARGLAARPERAQRVLQAIAKRAMQLDSIERVAKADSAEKARKDSVTRAADRARADSGTRPERKRGATPAVKTTPAPKAP